jgi:uncharacterized delta-60 repeat protein
MKLTLLIFSFCLSIICLAQSGAPVSGFGTNGKVITPVGSGNDRAFDLGVQVDGKVVVLGYTESGTDRHIALVRYTNNGMLDNSFGTGGMVTTAFVGSLNHFPEVEIQADGKIIVAGQVQSSTSTDFLLVRYNSDGTLDNTFGTNGIVITPVGSAADGATDILIQPDGKVVAAGRGFFSNNDFTFVRYNTNGTLDNSFDGDGIASVSIGVASDELQAIAIQPDGKIVATGYSSITVGMSTTIDVVVVRLNADGSLDNTFDGDGKLTTQVGTTNDHAYDIVIQSDGKIVIVGNTVGFSNTDLMLLRYNSNGSLDNSFDGDGKLVIDISTQDDFRSISLQNDGKIIVGGDVLNGSEQDFAAVRINTDGSLDNSFDGDGRAFLPISNSDNKAWGMALTTGRIYIAGHTAMNGTEDFVIAALNNDASPLPLRLLSFTGSANAGEAKLEWRLSGDLHGSTISLQKSLDGQNFLTVKDQATASSVTVFIDRNFTGSKNYYRLKITEKDGSVTYSNILMLRTAADQSLKVYPNPAKGSLFVQISSAGRSDIRLINPSGTLVKSHIINSVPNSTHMIDISGLQKGLYILTINAAERVITQSVMVE